jgi:hypothetical protein
MNWPGETDGKPGRHSRRPWLRFAGRVKSPDIDGVARKNEREGRGVVKVLSVDQQACHATPRTIHQTGP